MSRPLHVSTTPDLAVVGGGVIGLAAAILAARCGARVVLLEADAAAHGASVRNFGLITVSGQARGPVWDLSLRSRDLWECIAADAGVAILQRGMVIAAQTGEAAAVLAAFLQTEMGAHCQALTIPEAVRAVGLLRGDTLQGAVWSPHELRVDAREALPALAHFARALGVDVRFGAPVGAVRPGAVTLMNGETIAAARVLACTGAQMRRLAPPALSPRLPACTKLHMLRVALPEGARSLDAPAVGDLTLARYPGFGDLPEAAPLKARLAVTDADLLADGIHVIAVRNRDGTLTIGDSHHDGAGDSADPFQPAAVDARILEAANRFLDLDGAEVVERWTGAYPKATGEDWLLEETAPGVWFAAVLGGKGMTLSFGFAEKVLGAIGLCEPAAA